MPTLHSKCPATGEILKELATTDPETLPQIFERARTAQAKWALLPVRKRAAHLLQIREALLNQADQVISLISQENGKPKFEALSNEVLPIVDMLTYFAKRGPRTLRDREIPLTLMKHRKSYLNYWPLGVVAVISPWNYPFMLPFADILMALVAGNAVIFKPSEITPQIGLKIQELCDLGGIPGDLVQTVLGDGTLGAAVIKNRPNKIFFTGSVPTGKKIMAAASETLIPVNLELGGKDAMIVLPDADLDFATSAALWGSFSNSGQVCASTERILVHESIANTFLELLKTKTSRLRIRSAQSGPNDFDLGAITFAKQKLTYEAHLAEAIEKEAQIITGGLFAPGGHALIPTIVAGSKVEDLQVYQEETFGPIVAVTTFKSVAEAITKANQSRYGLLASVITRDIALGEQIARQLEVGTVTINEVTYTGGLGETPWGGVKESGMGRTHSELGLMEFVNVRHIHKPRSRAFVFKSLWWFPYGPFQYATFRYLMNLYRKHWGDKIRALPHFVWNLAQFLKHEKRL